MPIVCLVDITMTNHPRLKKLPIYRAQIQLADLILFRKTELLELEKIDELKIQFDIDFPGKNYAEESFCDEFYLSTDIIQTNPKESKLVVIYLETEPNGFDLLKTKLENL